MITDDERAWLKSDDMVTYGVAEDKLRQLFDIRRAAGDVVETFTTLGKNGYQKSLSIEKLREALEKSKGAL